MAKKGIISKIKRQCTLTSQEVKDMYEYDKIKNMEWDGIPGLMDEDYYVEYRDTTGRDIHQQACSVFAVQRPKWDVLPRGLGDVKTAEEFERSIEWYFWKAAQYGRKPFTSEAMSHINLYNKVCGQLEWLNDYFCVHNYHPANVRYEYGDTLQWVAVVENIYATEVIEHWSDYAKPNWFEKLTKGDSIGAALKKIQELVDEDEEQRVMYIDYTDNKTRYVYCYPVSDETVDETLGYDDDGKEKQNTDIIEIQDKDNENGFINWAISENEGDPLLAPLLKGKYYDNINDLETMKATSLYRRGLFPLLMQEGREDADISIDYQHDIIKVPQGAKGTLIQPQPLDPGFNEMSAQMRSRMDKSMAVQNVSQVQVSNVQNATLDSQIKLWLMQYEPAKRCAEKYYEQLASLMFRWAKKKDKVLLAMRMYPKEIDGQMMSKGTEISINPDQINLDALYVKCTILPNNPTDVMQLINEISMLKQSGVPVDSASLIERLDWGDPSIMREKFEREQIRDASLQGKLKEIIGEVDNELQMKMMQFKAGLDAQMLQMQQQQQAQLQQQAQGMPQGQAAQQSQPIPSDQAMSGQGFNAAQGGIPPQGANPGITQGMR